MDGSAATRIPAVRAHGARIPKIGFGTWELEGGEAEEGVRDALELGYRHIDTAYAYGNEREIGTAIGGSGIDREEIFVTTKLWIDDLSAAGVEAQLDQSLRALGADYVDLLLIHWPNPEFPTAATLEAMAAARERGRVRHLGVSNFPPAELAEALRISPAPLVANQVEMHPYLDQSELVALTAEHGMALEAYSPLAHGALLEDRTMAEIGERHGKSPAQVALRWLIEQANVVALPRSSTHENRAANLDVFDFELDPGEHERIGALARPDGRQIDPSFAPDWG
jgi:2,5-diketo-D-gluconate reductase B